ncbi:NAD(P)/FAD-dependent oxidoreductase [Leifsonia kafniensis]
MTNNSHHDVIVLGAGAAGLSAGLVLARAQADVMLIDSGSPRNAAAAHMQGFVSRDGMPPAEFLSMGRQEICGYGGTVVSASVAAVTRRDDDWITVTLTDERALEARALLVATGLTDEIPDLPGVRERWGSLVHHCPYCHGYEVRNQEIVVIGGPARAMSLKQAGLLRRYSDRVTLVTNGIEMTDDETRRLEKFRVRIVDGTVSRLIGDTGTLDGIALTDGRTVGCDAAFIAPRPRPNDGLLRSLGCAIDPQTAFVAVDAAGQTSVPGVWAAGNVVTPSAQVISAAGAGSSAAIAINGWLLDQDLNRASAR